MAKKSTLKGAPRELERAGNLGLAFANTGFPQRDDRRKNSRATPSVPLARYDELVTWVQRMGRLAATDGERLRRIAAESPEDASAALTLAVELRAAMQRIFTALALDQEPRSEDLAMVNRRLQPLCDGQACIHRLPKM